jgi:hypothetical protein
LEDEGDVRTRSPQQLWRSVDVSLGRDRIRSSPSITAEAMHSFFNQKVTHIPSSTENAPAWGALLSGPPRPWPTQNFFRVYLLCICYVFIYCCYCIYCCVFIMCISVYLQCIWPTQNYWSLNMPPL